MPGKKRTTSAKQSSISKRHKPQAKPKKKYTGPKNGDGPDGGEAVEAPAPRKSAFPADKARMESAKKDRKGKGPAYIETVEAQSDDESGGSEAGMDVDSELDDINDQAAFLTKLDTKGMAA